MTPANLKTVQRTAQHQCVWASAALSLIIPAAFLWAQAPEPSRPDQAETKIQEAVQAGPGLPKPSVLEETAPAPPVESFEAGHSEDFQAQWAGFSPEEKTALLEAYPDIKGEAQAAWDKAAPGRRRELLKNDALLSRRALKHRWEEAAVEEKAAFLDAQPKILAKIGGRWQNASAEEVRKFMKKLPRPGRKAVHHSWDQATAGEKIAFLAAHPETQKRLRERWEKLGRRQREDFLRHIQTLASLSPRKAWSEFSVEERAAFVEIQAESEALRLRWEKAAPQKRAELLSKKSAPVASPNKGKAQVKGSHKAGPMAPRPVPPAK